MTEQNQVTDSVFEIFADARSTFNEDTSIQRVNEIPDTSDIPLDDETHWLEIPNVICSYVDMTDSTGLSADHLDESTASIYNFFTGTAVQIFHDFDTPYIDVRGDGVFGLFNQDQVYTALCATISFKTFVETVFRASLEEEFDISNVGGHYGMDQKTVLVKQIGLRRYDDREDRKNEVWGGETVNMAAKLASVGNRGELHASERYFQELQDEKATITCGCKNGEDVGEPEPLWDEVDLSDEDRGDGEDFSNKYNALQESNFDSVYRLTSKWCKRHGKEYCEALLKEDG